MEILSHFRTIEELTKTLSREQGLLSEMFEKRKLMKFPLGLALELVGGNETRLRRLVDYGVLVETGNTIEIESDYLNFFEEVLNVNEEISVLSVQECINTLKEYIGYFLQESNTNRKAGYQDSVRQLLKKTGFRTLKNVVDLKRNMDNAMVIGTNDNDVRGVVVLQTGEVVDVVGLDNAVAILVANLLAADLVAIVVEPL